MGVRFPWCYCQVLPYVRPIAVRSGSAYADVRGAKLRAVSRFGIVLSRALLITYHAIEHGPQPLCVDPDLFRRHVETVLSDGARIVDVTTLVDQLSAPPSSERLVAFTFDDGFSSVARHAAPILSSYGVGATVFCVAGHVGGRNDWPTDRAGGLVSSLMSEEDIAQIVSDGLEVGSHGFSHVPISRVEGDLLRREVVESKQMLERLSGTTVRSFAYPYGALPDEDSRRLVGSTYDAACTTRLAAVDVGADLHLLPRVDAHYLRRPEILRRAVSGSLDSYLLLRRLGSRARRVLRPDYVTA